jgi:5,10-methylenetetrahydrofolate reductase
MLDGKGPFGTDLEEQATAVICTLHNDRELRERVWKLWCVVQSRPSIDDQVREALAEIVREIVAARGLDPGTWPHHNQAVERAFERILGEVDEDGLPGRQS